MEEGHKKRKTEEEKKEAVAGPRRVLFVGNSFTSRNDVPALVAHMARQRGREMQTASVVRGGASLRQHANANAFDEAASNDVVVLQEQSTLPGKNAARFHDNVRLCAKLIREKNALTTIVLYSTWSRLDEPEKQKVIAEAYRTIGEEVGARVAAVGDAFAAILGGNDKEAEEEKKEGTKKAKSGSKKDVVLHDKDKSHANALGSYVAACVLFATLTGESPVGLAYSGIMDKDALLRLQQAAFEAAQQ